jgi:polyhydroxyalkanoate synthesis regulator phasin
MMQDYNKILVEMIRYMQFLFEQSINSTQMMFEHADKMLLYAVEQGDVTQDESRKHFNEWMETSKKLRDDYVKVMREQFEQIEAYYKK